MVMGFALPPTLNKCSKTTNLAAALCFHRLLFAKIYKETNSFLDAKPDGSVTANVMLCHVLIHVLSIFIIRHTNFSWSRSLFRISSDTKVIKIVNNRFLHMKQT